MALQLRVHPYYVHPGESLAVDLMDSANEMESAVRPFMDWAMQVPEPKTGKLDWKTFPFQVELYTEAAADKEVVIKKATQVGVSAYLVRWTMYWADVRMKTSLYVFPKLKQMYDFSDTRIKAAIEASDYLLTRIPPQSVQNKGLRQVGRGWVYFRGSESKADLDSVDADVLALDEYDTLVQANIEDAERRLSGPLSIGLIRRVGVPSRPNRGIDKLYADSDQRRWNVKCDCGEWQDIDFFKNVDLATATRVCRKCRKPLDTSGGEWVAAYPDRGARGYHIPRLIVPSVNVADIVKNSRKTAPYQRQVFFNKDLGLAYAPAEGRLSDQVLAAAQREDIESLPSLVTDHAVTMGIDVASVRNFNIRISDHFAPRKKRAVWIGEASSIDEVAKLMDRYGVNMAVIDHLPDGRLARSFAERFHGRVYLVAFAPNQRQILQFDAADHFCTVRRVEAIDATFEQIRQQRNLLPMALPEDYIAHLTTPVRTDEEDELGKRVVSYVSDGPDDYAMAEVYDMVASELLWAQEQVDEAEREDIRPLEDFMEFQRAKLDYEDDLDWHPGPTEDEYSVDDVR